MPGEKVEQINSCGTLALLEEGVAELARSESDTPELDAQLLLSRALGMERMFMLADPPQHVQNSTKAAYRRFLARRAAGEPVAYITGVREFYKSSFMVNGAVLIPRPETELLVEEILRRFDTKTKIGLLDIGTGCGCIALSLSMERPNWEITATDLSPEALTVAKQNAKSFGVENIRFIQSDLFSAINGRYDVICSNPPYIDGAIRENLQVELREYEPATALFTTDSGLTVIKELVRKVGDYLEPGGLFICEIGYDQANAVEKLFDTPAWSQINFHRDLQGHMRVASAVYKAKLESEVEAKNDAGVNG